MTKFFLFENINAFVATMCRRKLTMSVLWHSLNLKLTKSSVYKNKFGKILIYAENNRDLLISCTNF